MLRAIFICPDQKLASDLQAVLASMPVALVRLLEHYPSEAELSRLLSSLTPEVILLSVQDLQAAEAVAKEVEMQEGPPGGVSQSGSLGLRVQNLAPAPGQVGKAKDEIAAIDA